MWEPLLIFVLGMTYSHCKSELFKKQKYHMGKAIRKHLKWWVFISNLMSKTFGDGLHAFPIRTDAVQTVHHKPYSLRFCP